MDDKRTVETLDEHGSDEQGIAQRWRAEIELYEEEFETYFKRCDAILERYKDERSTASTKKLPRFNVLWSNSNVIGPSIYAQRAKLECSRRFHDKDPIARSACEVLERSINGALDDDRYDYDGVMLRARQDFELLARGVIWERYEPVLVSGQITDDQTGNEGEAEQPQERLVYEHVCTEHLHYRDFGHTSGARAWEEVSAVWRKAYLSRAELTERFGDKGRKVPLNHCPSAIKDRADRDALHFSHLRKAVVYEVWDRATKKVYWINKDTDIPLDVRDDTLGLRGFFPCPKPSYGTLTNDSLVPIPDYVQIQDLCSELDMLTARIKLITDAIKVRGGYEKSSPDLQRMLKGEENALVPMDLRGLLASGQRVESMVVWLPIDMMAGVLQVLYDARERTKQMIYEISGNSDIMRGATDARETASAQRIKGQFASLRIQTKRNEFNRFVRDGLRIKAEIVAEKFQPQTIALMIGIDQQSPEDQQQFMQALELLRNDTLRAYRVDIETDSTIALDEQAEKEDATELVVNIGQYFQNAMPIVQQMPSFGPVVAEMLLFIVKRYKAGRQFETRLEEALQQAIGAQQQQAEQQGPDPAAMEVQMKAQAQQAADQGKMMLEQERLKLKQAELQQSGMLKQAELQLKGELGYADLQQKATRDQAELDIARTKATAEILGNQQQRENSAALAWSRAQQGGNGKQSI